MFEIVPEKLERLVILVENSQSENTQSLFEQFFLSADSF